MLVSPLSGHSALPSRQPGDRSSACSAVGMCLVPDAVKGTCLQLCVFCMKEKKRKGYDVDCD